MQPAMATFSCESLKSRDLCIDNYGRFRNASCAPARTSILPVSCGSVMDHFVGRLQLGLRFGYGRRCCHIRPRDERTILWRRSLLCGKAPKPDKWRASDPAGIDCGKLDTSIRCPSRNFRELEHVTILYCGLTVHTLTQHTVAKWSQSALFNQTDSSPRRGNLKFWVRSLLCSITTIILSFLQALQVEAVTADFTVFDCKDISDYYAPLKGLEGPSLKTRLHDIIKDHQVFRYSQVWDALKVLDEAEDDPSSVIEIYSLKRAPKSFQASSNGWNREHLWPRSYGLLLGRPEFSDLHNLRPADVNVNSSRGNKYFGECTSTLTIICMVPANKEAAPDTGTNKDIWMPPVQLAEGLLVSHYRNLLQEPQKCSPADIGRRVSSPRIIAHKLTVYSCQVRGDIGRALMYMAVRYGSDQPTGSPELQLSDSPDVGSGQMGLLSDLLRWNEIDPPSKLEMQRNDRVCSFISTIATPLSTILSMHNQFGGMARGKKVVPHTLYFFKDLGGDG